MTTSLNFFLRLSAMMILVGLLLNCCGEEEAQQEARTTTTETTEPESVITLASRLDSLTKSFEETTKPEVLEAFQGGIDVVRASGIAEQALKVGDTVPAFELQEAHGKMISLERLTLGGLAILSFYRGGWCPYCNLELQALEDILPELQRYEIGIAAISPEWPDSAISTKTRNKLRYYILCDNDNKVARTFGLVHEQSPEVEKVLSEMIDIKAYNGLDKWDLPLPATYIVDSARVVRWVFIDPDYRKRAEITELIKTIEDILLTMP